jgi:hypothetical protein
MDFENQNTWPFWYTGGAGYQVQLDTDIVHTGKQSLRSELIDPELANRLPATQP